jgi:hypothetical protein
MFAATMMLPAMLASSTPAFAKAKSAADLVGTWRLIATSQRLDDNTVRPDPDVGPNGVGYLIYTSTGQVCALLNDPQRPKWSVESKPSDVEAQAIFDKMVAYCGTYSFDAASGVVEHHIEIDLMPNRVGTTRKRLVTLTGDTLVLRPTPLPPGMSEWTITWKRVRR